jgi:hypothetical protein
MPTDYWLSKLFYDLQQHDRAAAYRADRAGFLAAYPLDDTIRTALLTDDVATLAPRVNAYLLRYYFTASGMSDAVFLERIRACAPAADG